MKKLLSVFIGVVFCLGIFSLAQAADKFGYVSIERVGDAYQKANDYMKKLDEKEAAYNTEIEKKKNEVKQFQDKVNLLSDKEKEAKAPELEAKIKSLQDFMRQKASDYRKESIDKTIELSKDIKDAINKYAEKENFTLIFDAAALHYQPKGMDITDKIIDILNKDFGPKKK